MSIAAKPERQRNRSAELPTDSESGRRRSVGNPGTNETGRRFGFGGILAIAATLVLVGMVAGASLWLYAAYAAVAVTAGNYLIARNWSTAAMARRRPCPLEVTVGATVAVGIEIENRGKLPIGWLLAEDLLPRAALMYRPPALEVEGTRLRLMFFWPKQKHLVHYRVTCHRRGYYQIGPLVLETGDLMGLTRRYRVGAMPQYLLVMPKVVPLSGYDIASRRPVGEIRITNQLIDDPTRLRGIRQWQPGDPMRQVHWAATARTGRLHSKVYEPTTLAGATIVLDLHKQTNPDEHEPVRTDLAITFAASISAALYEMGQPIGLMSNGRDAADRVRTEGWANDFRTRSSAQTMLAMRDQDVRIRPVIVSAATGPIHQQEIQRTLARLERTDAQPLSQALIEAESRLARNTTLMIVLQKSEGATTHAILGFARRGWSVMVIVNTGDLNQYTEVAGPFVAANIAVLQLCDESQLAEVCQQAVLR